VEWAEDFFAKGFKLDEDSGSVDYWQRRENLSVQEGQLLMTVYPPQPGTPGCDLLGRRLPVERARPARVRLGSHVRQKEDAAGVQSLYADRSGRLRWADCVLAVDDVYTIRGDVGLETGHIDHPGALVILGDIQAGAQVKAAGDIVVKGMVEPATIITQGSLTVQGGVIGGQDSRLELGGGLHARYLLEAEVDAGEDIEIVNEIMQSRVRTRGAVIVPKGRIVGSEVMALRGIQVGQAGGEGPCATVLISGIDYRLAAAREPREAKIAKYERQLDKIRPRLEQARQAKRVLSPTQSAAVKELLVQAQELEKATSQLRQEVNDLIRIAEQRRRETITVNRQIHPETVLQIGEAKTRIPSLVDEPRTFTRHGGDIVIASPEDS
jgi:uncharacterized protein (DUF342 family)